MIENMLSEMEATGNPRDAVLMKAYMKGHFDYYGLKSVPRRTIFQKHFDKKAIKDRAHLISLVDQLWQEPHREAQYAAMDLLDKFKPWMTIDMLPHIENLITTKSWWDTVDHLAVHQIGLILSKLSPQQRKTIAYRYLESNHLWLQRTAIIFQLFYKENTDTELLSECILATISEKNFFIRKAHGWALRHYSKTNKPFVAQFLSNHRDVLSPLAIKEASKYLTSV